MHLDKHVSKGHDYYYVAQTQRIDKRVSKKRILYLGRLDNIDEIRRLELERKISDIDSPELVPLFRSKLYSLGYRFPTLFSSFTVDKVFDLGLPVALHKICEDIQLVDIVNNYSPKGGGLSLGKLVEIMAIHRICDPGSVRSLTRWYPTTALPLFTGVRPEDITYDVTLNALDYLQPGLTTPMQVDLYRNIRKVYGYECERLDIDLTSTYFEGLKCILAKFGYSRDKRRDRPQVVIGFVVDQEGILVTHKTWPGNRTDAKSLKPFNRLLSDTFGLDCPRVVDRGMATHENLKYMDRRKERYLVALRAKVKSTGLLDEIKIPRSKWDEIYEGEFATSIVKGRRKYVINWNSSVANTNRKGRNAKVRKAEKELKALQKRITDGNIKSKTERDEEIGYILKKHRVKSFVKVSRNKRGNGFTFDRAEKLSTKNRQEGYQVFVTTEKDLAPKDVVASYRQRDEVEKAIQSIKNVINIRPMYVWTKEHVLGRIFICAQSYQLRSVMGHVLKQDDMSMSLNDAIWHLDRLKTVSVIATGDEVQVFRKITTMDKEQLALVNIFDLKGHLNDLEVGDGGI